MLGGFFSKDILRAMSVGLNLVVATFVGLGIGYLLDKYFNTRPWLTLIFMVLGIIAGFRELFRFINRQGNNGPGSDKEDR